MDQIYLGAAEKEPGPKRESLNGEADFEMAAQATSFGKFNYFIIATILPAACAQIFEVQSLSYVLPVAQCDLDLTLNAKGQLNSITFAGMISSAFVWGQLSDKFGRKKMMLYGYLLHWFAMLVASLSQSFTMLMITKYFGGFIVNGPSTAALSLWTEFHAAKYRTRIQLVRGIMSATGSILLPLLSWVIFPRQLDFTLFSSIQIHSWNVFLMICSLAPLVSGIMYSFSPESPKFLMSIGKNEEALQIFKNIYRLNTGNSEDTYPVKRLVDEMTLDVNEKEQEESKTDSTDLFSSVKPLFLPPYILKLLLACSNAFLVIIGINTLKFWQPQLLQAVNDYMYLHNGTSSSMCEMIELIVPKNTSTVCTVNWDNASVYINSFIINGCQLVSFLLIGTVAGKIGKKPIMISTAIVSGLCSLAIYFAPNSEVLVALYAAFIAISAVCINIGSVITLELFPTKFRTTSIALHMTNIWLGSVIGNLIFPYLITSGCLPPFLFITLCIFASAFLSCFFPNTENKALK